MMRFPKIKEYLLFYKMPSFKGFEVIDKYKVEEWDKENNIYLENFSKADRERIGQISNGDNISTKDVEEALRLLRPVKKVSLSSKVKSLGIENEAINDWLFENSYRIVKTCGSASLAKLVARIRAKPKQDIACALSNEGVLFFYITDYNPNTPQPRLRVIFADENIYKNPCDFWQDIKTTGAIANEGGVQLLNGKKPEYLLYRIIKMVTKKEDLVLDFFGGSGTTGAVAHKMGRKYILCEQLDEHIEKEIERLSNVVLGDNTGISEATGWKGGGSFVYCELAKSNQLFVERIEAAKKESELEKIWSEMLATGFISCKIDPAKFSMKDEDFKALSLKDKKRILMDLLDMNQLYVNYCDIDDKTFKISPADKAFTRSFYGDK